MMTVKEIARRSGVSVRTLHHYHAIGLLTPSSVTEAGYRLYDEAALERLMLIVLYRELGFSLGKIAGLLNAPDFDRNRALEEQIRLLQEKKKHIESRITLARGIHLVGVEGLDLTDVEWRKLDEYTEQAQTLYGKTPAFQEWKEKSRGRTKDDEKALGEGMMALMAEAGAYRHLPPDAPEAQAWAARLQAYITAHYYTCTPAMLRSLASLYAGGGSMTERIDEAGGMGTGCYAGDVLKLYCDRKEA